VGEAAGAELGHRHVDDLDQVARLPHRDAALADARIAEADDLALDAEHLVGGRAIGDPDVQFHLAAAAGEVEDVGVGRVPSASGGGVSAAGGESRQAPRPASAATAPSALTRPV